jgi:3-dehydroquinate synthase
MEIVEKDPGETGLRKILNFGHTIGHAVETLSHKKNIALFHGEAVAAGLAAESIISSKILGLKQQETEEICEIINTHFPSYVFCEDDIPELIDIMTHDKKNVDGRINFTLITDIGEAKIDQFCESHIIKNSLSEYLGYCQRNRMNI